MRFMLVLLLITTVPAMAEMQAPEMWALHGQGTIIEQYHPAFRSAFRGPNSLDPGSRGNETVTLTLYGGVRPWSGGEVWADGEVDQGFGLSDTLGVAAFTNGEGSKVGEANPYFRLHQLFFRQTFDLGGEGEDVARPLTSLGCARTRSNFILNRGNFQRSIFSIPTTMPHDPSQDFLNWAVIDAGAYDYAADAWGYSYGVAGEWNQDNWSFRGGLFDMSRAPNGTELVRGFGQYQLDAEIERRFQISGRDGAVKLLGWTDRADLGAYDNATALALVVHQLPDLSLVRHPRFRPGGSLNLEQALDDDLGFFLRASLADGSQESYEFTDMDRSISTGFSLKGDGWGRKDDAAGLALEDGAVSKSAQNFLAADDLGILVGDGLPDT